MNSLTVFEEREVLGVKLQMYGTVEEPLFLAKDVAIWIEHSDVSTMVRKLDESEKVTNNVCTLGGVQSALFITEDGLYETLMLSRKPIAKEFKREVKNILKQIRKTGGYIPVKENESNEEFLARAFLIANETLKKKDELLALQKPKVEAYETLMDSRGNMDFAEFVKSAKLTIGRNTFMSILRDEEIIRKNNEPYQQYRKYFEVIQTVANGRSYSKTLVTKCGADWLVKKCREWDIVG